MAGIYKPPDSNLNRFLTEFDKILERYSNLFIFGDLNVNLFNDNNSVKNYVTTINSNGYRILNSTGLSMFTRHDTVNNTKTCIDHITTDKFLNYNFLFATDHILDVDHKALLLSVEEKTPHSLTRKNKIISLTKINHKQITDLNLIQNISNSNFNDMMNDFKNILDSNTMLITYKEKFRKQFMNTEIYNYIIIRGNYKSLTRKYTNCEMAKLRYRYYRNLVTKFQKCMNDSRKTWRQINKIIYNNDQLAKKIDITLNINNNMVFDPPLVAELLNRSFITIPIEIKNNIHVNSLHAFSMRNIVNHDILFPLVAFDSTESEILSIIKNMKNSDNRDIYGLSNNLFKKYKDIIAGKISKLINESMTIGVFPKELKVAVDKPILKNGIRTDINNYRPIASLPLLLRFLNM
jgi:hypothetical protein